MMCLLAHSIGIRSSAVVIGLDCSVDLHTLGEDEATQTPQQRQAADLIDAAKEVFAFSGPNARKTRLEYPAALPSC